MIKVREKYFMSRSKNMNRLLSFYLIKVMAIFSATLLLSLSMGHESHALEVPEYKVDMGTLRITEGKVNRKVVRKRSFAGEKAPPVERKLRPLRGKPVQVKKLYKTQPVEMQVREAVPIQRIEVTERNRVSVQLPLTLSIEEIYDYIDDLKYSELIGEKIYAAKVLGGGALRKYFNTNDPIAGDLYNALVSVFRTNKDEELLEPIALLLGRLGKKEAGRALLNSLSYSNSDKVKFSVIRSLGRLRYKGAVNQLIRTLRTEDDPELRQQAASALGSIMDSSATYALISALNDDDYYVAKEAIEALGKIGSPEAKYPLMNILNHDEDLELREAAAGALRKIENKMEK